MKTIILIGTIIAIIVLITIFRRTGRRLTERQIINSQQIVNAAMTEAVDELGETIGLAPIKKPLRSTLVANIWGHEVMAFEFQLPVSRAINHELIRTTFNAALDDYVKKHHLSGIDATEPVILVTDLWFDQRETVLHLDIAHLINAETLAYLHDLRRLNQSV